MSRTTIISSLHSLSPPHFASIPHLTSLHDDKQSCFRLLDFANILTKSNLNMNSHQSFHDENPITWPSCELLSNHTKRCASNINIITILQLSDAIVFGMKPTSPTSRFAFRTAKSFICTELCSRAPRTLKHNSSNKQQ